MYKERSRKPLREVQEQLKEVRERFKDAVDPRNPLGSILVESSYPPNRSCRELPRLSEFGGRSEGPSEHCVYRPAEIDPDGVISGTETERFHRIFGDPDLARVYLRLATRAGELLLLVPEDISSWFPPETLETDSPSMRWTFAVYDLAWKKLEDSLLRPRRDKSVWLGDASYRLDDLPLLREMGGQDPVIKQISNPPLSSGTPQSTTYYRRQRTQSTFYWVDQSVGASRMIWWASPYSKSRVGVIWESESMRMTTGLSLPAQNVAVYLPRGTRRSWN